MDSELQQLQKRIETLEANVSLLKGQLAIALQLLRVSPDSALAKARVILEKCLKDVYARLEVALPRNANELGGLLNNNQLTRLLPSRIVLRMNTVREFGNLGAHDKGDVSPSDAIHCLSHLVEILDWYVNELCVVTGDEVEEPPASAHHEAWAADALLAVEIDASSAERTRSLARAVAAKLAQQGCSSSSIEKTGIALQELLSNVVKHAGAPEPLARVRVDLRRRGDSVCGDTSPALRVGDRGNGFDLGERLGWCLEQLEETHKEHGLLRLVRYGSRLSQTVEPSHALDWQAGGGEPFDPREPPWEEDLSPLLLCKSPRVFPLALCLDHYVVIGREKYDPDELCHIVTVGSALRSHPRSSDLLGPFLAVLLEPLRRANPKVVCITVRGRHATVRMHGSDDGRFDLVAAHAIALTKAALPHAHAVVFADSEIETNREWASFAEERDLAFFENLEDCLEHVRALGGPP